MSTSEAPLYTEYLGTELEQNIRQLRSEISHHLKDSAGYSIAFAAACLLSPFFGVWLYDYTWMEMATISLPLGLYLVLAIWFVAFIRIFPKRRRLKKRASGDLYLLVRSTHGQRLLYEAQMVQQRSDQLLRLERLLTEFERELLLLTDEGADQNLVTERSRLVQQTFSDLFASDTFGSLDFAVQHQEIERELTRLKEAQQSLLTTLREEQDHD